MKNIKKMPKADRVNTKIFRKIVKEKSRPIIAQNPKNMEKYKLLIQNEAHNIERKIKTGEAEDRYLNRADKREYRKASRKTEVNSIVTPKSSQKMLDLLLRSKAHKKAEIEYMLKKRLAKEKFLRIKLNYPPRGFKRGTLNKIMDNWKDIASET